MARRGLLRSSRWTRRLQQTCLLALLGASLLACPASTGPAFEPVYFERQEDAGTVQVGIQSVAPFEEYVDSLQPRFKLTEQMAFDQAIALTQIEDLRQIKALLARIAVALPSTTRTVEEVLQRTGETQESSRTETTRETPPTAPAANAPTISSTLSQVPTAPTGTVMIDSALRYRAAAALFQDIALLSSYVREAAVGPDTTPYIVRLLVTVLPTSRSAPYDAYATVSFFLDTQGEPQFYLASRPEPEPSAQELTVMLKNLGCNGIGVKVIPLFVTDNLESTSISTAQESVRGIDASAGGVVSNVGLGGGVASQSDASQTTRGNDLNGIQTLAVTSENTVQLRLGAAPGRGGFRALPRTYNLTSLILIPSAFRQRPNTPPTQSPELVLACKYVRFFAQSYFREAEGGKLLPSGPKEDLGKSLTAFIREELGLPETANLAPTVDAAQWQDYLKFTTELGNVPGAQAKHAPALWPAIVNLVSTRGVSRGGFPLPQSIFRFFPLPQSTDPKVPILDDGKAARLTLNGGERLEKKGLHATLTFIYDGTSIQMESTEATVSEDQRAATITFPSIKNFFDKLATNPPPPPLPKLANVRVQYSPTLQRWSAVANQVTHNWKQDDCPIIPVKPEEAKKALPEFEIRATTDFIRARQDGTGEVAIEIKKTGDTQHDVFFSVSGAILASVDPPVPLSGAYPLGKADNRYLLSLKGLLVGRPVVIRSWRMNGKEAVSAPDITLGVVPEPALLQVHCQDLSGGCPATPPQQ